MSTIKNKVESSTTLSQKIRELLNRKGAVVLSNEIIKEVSKDYFPWFYFTLPNNPLSL